MANVNKCIFIGRLGKDPEIKDVSSDFKVCSFSLAISEKWKDKQTGEKRELTDWINCQAVNKQAELISQYVFKGDLLYVEGKFKTRTWEDKGGVKHYASFIQVEAFNFFPKPKTNQTDDTPGTYKSPGWDLPPSEMATQETLEDDDLPF